MQEQIAEQNFKKMCDESFNGIEKELAAPLYELDKYEDVYVEMSDGVQLITRIFFPKGSGPWPVILIRNPYIAAKYRSQVQALWFVKYGYAVVYQQVRGTLDSKGEWFPFENERKDGLDTVKWIVKQKWMNGNIGTFGGSYLGHVQWSIADKVPPEVKTMYFQVYGGDPYELFYMNGMFKQDIWTRWAMNMGRPEGNTFAKPVELQNKAIKVKPNIEMDQKLFGQKCQWYRNWITNTDPRDDYWNVGFWSEFKKIAENVNIPVMFQGGWFDVFLASMVKTFRRLPEKTKKESRFVIGPWHHGYKPGGDLKYPNENKLGIMLVKDALEWFDHHLKGTPYNHAKGVVETYTIGEERWKTWDGWIHPSKSRKFYMKTLPDLKYHGGKLIDQTCECSDAIAYKYDPENPVPSRGGSHLLAYLSDPEGAPGCSVIQDTPGSRDDVITFISESLLEDLSIAGNIKVHLNVSSDAEDTAFTAKLIEVFPDGKAYNIQDGITTMIYRNGIDNPLAYKPGEIVNLEIELLPITWRVKKGSKIRLDVSSSNFPAYHTHPNISGIWSLQENVKIAEQTIYTGGANQSFIEIPFTD